MTATKEKLIFPSIIAHLGQPTSVNCSNTETKWSYFVQNDIIYYSYDYSQCIV